MKARVCDRCKAVILPSDEVSSSVISLLQEGMEGTKYQELNQWDLCPKCTNSVSNYINGKIKLVKSEPQTTKQKKHRQKEDVKESI